MVSGGLNRAFGASLRRVISNSTSNRFKAFGVGVFVATILQSSTATSLIVSSFAARNVVTIAGAIALMLGADVGTTLAAQFMSLDLHWLVPVLLVSGFLVNSTMEASQYKYLGRTLVGIALALIALSMIREAATPLKESPAMEVLVAPLRSQPILAISLSVLITWLVHSGLGMVLLYMSFVAAGTIPIELGLYLVLGANIGSALAPVIMTMRDIPAGRRVPLGNLLIRGLGVVIFLPFMESLVIPFIESLHADPARMVVNFHTAFNLIVAMMFLPFIHSMTRVSEVILPDRPREEDESLPRYLDPTAFDQPPAALASVARETLRISDIVEKMLDQTLECLRNNDAHMLQNIRNLAGTVDTLYEACKNYMARLSTQSFDSAESRRYMQIMTFSTNLEHIGDIIDKNLLEMAAKKIHNQDHFSRQGFAEISALHTSVMESLKLAQNVFMTGDVSMAKKLFKDKTAMRKQEILAAESHFKRLSEGVAETIATSSLHLDILRDLRRINSYLSLIAYPILEEADALHRTRLKDKSAKGKKPAKAKKNADKDLDGNL